MSQTFKVTGMTCGHCEKAVTQAVKSVDGQAQVLIDRPAGLVTVQSAATAQALAKAIAAEGYAVTPA